MTDFTKAADGRTVPVYSHARGTVSQTGTVALLPAPGANTRYAVDYFKVQLTGSDATAGTVLWGTTPIDVFSLEQYSAFSFGAATPGQEWRLPANTALVFGAAGTSTFEWSARYFTESVY